MRCVVIEPDGVSILRAICQDLSTDVREVPMILLDGLAQSLVTVLLLVFQVHFLAVKFADERRILLSVGSFKFNADYFSGNACTGCLS